MGLEGLSMALMEQPDLVEAIMKKVEEQSVKCFDKCTSEKDVGAVFLGDDLAYTEGLLISPKHLRQYIFPVYRKLLDIAKSKGFKVLFHSDGKMWKILDDLVD